MSSTEAGVVAPAFEGDDWINHPEGTQVIRFIEIPGVARALQDAAALTQAAEAYEHQLQRELDQEFEGFTDADCKQMVGRTIDLNGAAQARGGLMSRLRRALWRSEDEEEDEEFEEIKMPKRAMNILSGSSELSKERREFSRLERARKDVIEASNNLSANGLDQWKLRTKNSVDDAALLPVGQVANDNSLERESIEDLQTYNTGFFGVDIAAPARYMYDLLRRSVTKRERDIALERNALRAARARARGRGGVLAARESIKKRTESLNKRASSISPGSRTTGDSDKAKERMKKRVDGEVNRLEKNEMIDETTLEAVAQILGLDKDKESVARAKVAARRLGDRFESRIADRELREAFRIRIQEQEDDMQNSLIRYPSLQLFMDKKSGRKSLEKDAQLESWMRPTVMFECKDNWTSKMHRLYETVYNTHRGGHMRTSTSLGQIQAVTGPIVREMLVQLPTFSTETRVNELGQSLEMGSDVISTDMARANAAYMRNVQRIFYFLRTALALADRQQEMGGEMLDCIRPLILTLPVVDKQGGATGVSDFQSLYWPEGYDTQLDAMYSQERCHTVLQRFNVNASRHAFVLDLISLTQGMALYPKRGGSSTEFVSETNKPMVKIADVFGLTAESVKADATVDSLRTLFSNIARATAASENPTEEQMTAARLLVWCIEQKRTSLAYKVLMHVQRHGANYKARAVHKNWQLQTSAMHAVQRVSSAMLSSFGRVRDDMEHENKDFAIDADELKKAGGSSQPLVKALVFIKKHMEDQVEQTGQYMWMQQHAKKQRFQAALARHEEAVSRKEIVLKSVTDHVRSFLRRGSGGKGKPGKPLDKRGLLLEALVRQYGTKLVTDAAQETDKAFKERMTGSATAYTRASAELRERQNPDLNRLTLGLFLGVPIDEGSKTDLLFQEAAIKERDEAQARRLEKRDASEHRSSGWRAVIGRRGKIRTERTADQELAAEQRKNREILAAASEVTKKDGTKSLISTLKQQLKQAEKDLNQKAADAVDLIRTSAQIRRDFVMATWRLFMDRDWTKTDAEWDKENTKWVESRDKLLKQMWDDLQGDKLEALQSKLPAPAAAATPDDGVLKTLSNLFSKFGDLFGSGASPTKRVSRTSVRRSGTGTRSSRGSSGAAGTEQMLEVLNDNMSTFELAGWLINPEAEATGSDPFPEHAALQKAAGGKGKSLSQSLKTLKGKVPTESKNEVEDLTHIYNFPTVLDAIGSSTLFNIYRSYYYWGVGSVPVIHDNLILMRNLRPQKPDDVPHFLIAHAYDKLLQLAKRAGVKQGDLTGLKPVTLANAKTLKDKIDNESNKAFKEDAAVLFGSIERDLATTAHPHLALQLRVIIKYQEQAEKANAAGVSLDKVAGEDYVFVDDAPTLNGEYVSVSIERKVIKDLVNTMIGKEDKDHSAKFDEIVEDAYKTALAAFKS